MQTDPIQGYVSFIAMHVSNLEASRRFYCEGLGFKEVSHLLVEGKSPTAVELGLDSLRTEGLFVERDGIRIQLQHQNRPESVELPPVRQQLGFSHFGIRVSDLDAVLKRVLEFGGEVPEGRRHKNAQYQSEVARVMDPDGLRIEVLQMPGELDSLPGKSLRQ